MFACTGLSEVLGSLYRAAHQVLEDSGVPECLDFAEATYRPVVDKHVGHALPAREVREPTAQYGVLGGVDDLEVVSPAPEESFRLPAAPGRVSDVELYLLLIHRANTPYLATSITR